MSIMSDTYIVKSDGKFTVYVFGGFTFPDTFAREAKRKKKSVFQLFADVRVCTDGKWHDLNHEEFCVCQVKRNSVSFTPDADKEHLPFCMGEKEIYDKTVDIVNAYYSAKEGKDAYVWVGRE